LWFGAGGNYFNGIVRPEKTSWIKDASATALNPDADAHLREVALQLQTTDMTLAPGASQTVAAKVFFGPRQRDLLKNAYYAAPGIEYQHTLDITSSCAWCTFSWLVDVLMMLLGVFHAVLRDWGLAIIALVFLVRAILHPITKRSQVNMAQMGKMGPEIERIKKKYGDDKEAMNRAMMQFYKSHGATPVLGCLPMFLQMPIWIALYSGLSSTFELRQQPFLYGLTWIKDLSQPDHLIKFSSPIQFLLFHFDGINVLPILMGVAYFLQQKFTPKPPATTPEQQQQQKMMQWMTLLFPLMLYSSPSGLNLYIFTSTVFGIIESKIVRKHIAEREAAAKTGPLIVDGEVLDARDAEPKKQGGGLMGWFTKLQAMADKAREDAERQARNRKR
ncbi:MAG: membrane protein insertase YidC, partial [Tepidisphaeraceae bacterium]